MIKSEIIYEKFSTACEQAKSNRIIKFKGYGDSLPADIYPAIILSVGDETSEEISMSANIHEIEIILKVSVDGSPDRLDRNIYAVRRAIHKIIMKCKNLDLDFVQKVKFANQSGTNYSGEGDSYRASTDITYKISFISRFDE